MTEAAEFRQRLVAKNAEYFKRDGDQRSKYNDYLRRGGLLEDIPSKISTESDDWLEDWLKGVANIYLDHLEKRILDDAVQAAVPRLRTILIATSNENVLSSQLITFSDGSK